MSSTQRIAPLYPEAVKLIDWVIAVQQGDFQHEWLELTIEEEGHVGVFYVSKNPARVDGVFETISAQDNQKLADYLGCTLLTPKLLEARWDACDVKLQPLPSGLVKPGGTISNTSGKEHSDAVLRYIESLGEDPYDKSFGGIGKAWLIDLEDEMATNGGWFVHKDEVTMHKGKPTWKGIPLLKSWTLPDVFCIQKGGLDPWLESIGASDPELGDAHDNRHHDYSQKAFFLREDCLIDGKRSDVRTVMLNQEFAFLVTHHGRPLASVRVPSVTPYPRMSSIPVPKPEEDDHPTVPRMPSISLWAETLSQAEIMLARGVHEDIGPNDGEVIREAAKLFGLTPPINWCAVTFGLWLHEASEIIGVEPPIAGSPGAQATMLQFKEAGRWVAAKDITDAVLLPGNVPIWTRPPHSWTGHIGILKSYDPEKRIMHTIEANSGPKADKVAAMERSRDDKRLLGIGILNDGSETTNVATWDPSLWEHTVELVNTQEECWGGCDPLAEVEVIAEAASQAKIIGESGFEILKSQFEDWAVQLGLLERIEPTLVSKTLRAVEEAINGEGEDKV